MQIRYHDLSLHQFIKSSQHCGSGNSCKRGAVSHPLGLDRSKRHEARFTRVLSGSVNRMKYYQVNLQLASSSFSSLLFVIR